MSNRRFLNKFGLNLSGALLGLSFVAQPATAQNLVETMNQAIESHPQVKRAEAFERFSKHEKKKEWGAYLPNITITGSTGRERSKNPALKSSGVDSRSLTRDEGSLSIRQLIFDGMEVVNRARKFESLAMGAAYETDSARSTLGLRTVDAYLNVLRNRELLGIADKRRADHEEILKMVEQRQESGVGRSSDVEQVRGRLALARARIERFQANLDNAIETYREVVGDVPGDLERIEVSQVVTMLPKNLEDARQTALTSHPLIHVAQQSVDAARFAVKEARGKFFPTVSLQGDASDNRNLDGIVGNNSDMSAKIVVTYNLFNGRSDFEDKQGKDAALEEQLHEQERFEREISRDVTVSWNLFNSSLLDLKYFIEHRDSSQLALDAYKKQYLIAQRTLFDLLNGADELFEAEESVTNAHYTSLLRGYQVLGSMGTLVSAVNDQGQTL